MYTRIIGITLKLAPKMDNELLWKIALKITSIMLSMLF